MGKVCVGKRARGEAIRKAREFVREKERKVVEESKHFFYNGQMGADRLRTAVHYLLEAEGVVDRLTGQDAEA